MPILIFMKAIETLAVCGVYKITFNKEFFYIGSSINLRRRLFIWEHKFRKRKTKNIKIQQIISSEFDYEFEILELTSTYAEALLKEAFCISSNAGSEYILNMVGKGEKTFSIRVDVGVKVAAFNKLGEYVKTYKSINEAEKVYGKDAVRRFFRGEKLTCKKHVFKKLDKNGECIEFTPREKKNQRHRSGVRVHKLDKPVLKYSIAGDLVARFENQVDAANELKVARGSINRVLNKKRNHIHGFVYRYA